MLKVLSNPKTNAYLEFKSAVLSDMFPWYWQKESTPNHAQDGRVNTSFYSHALIARPGAHPFKIAEPVSNLAKLASQALVEILSVNDVPINAFIRISANSVEPTAEMLATVEHEDHTFPHTNILVYLNETSAGTVVEGETSTPSEDQAILFSGRHYHYTPTDKRRVVLVATFI